MAKRRHYKTGPKKGQFRSGKARKSNPKKKRKSKSKAKPKKRRKSMAKKKTKRRRRRRAAGMNSDLMKKAKVAGWTAVYAYMKEKSTYGPTMMKAPYVEAIGFDATAMLAAHYAAKHGPRFAKKPLDALATGLAGVVGYRFGAAGFKISGMGGDGALEEGDDELAGDVDPDDFDDDDDDDDAEG